MGKYVCFKSPVLKAKIPRDASLRVRDFSIALAIQQRG